MFSFLKAALPQNSGGGGQSTPVTLREKQRATEDTLDAAREHLHGGAAPPGVAGGARAVAGAALPEGPPPDEFAKFKALSKKANAASTAALSARRKPTPEEAAAIKAYADAYEARRARTNAGQAENVARGKVLADEAAAYMKAHPEEQQLTSRNYVTGERMQYATKDAAAHHADQLEKFHQHFYDWEREKRPDQAWFRDLNNRLIGTVRKHVNPGGLLDRVLPQQDPAYHGREGDFLLDGVSKAGDAMNGAFATTGVGSTMQGLASRAGYGGLRAEDAPTGGSDVASTQLSAPPTAKEPNDLMLPSGKGERGGSAKSAYIARLCWEQDLDGFDPANPQEGLSPGKVFRMGDDASKDLKARAEKRHLEQLKLRRAETALSKWVLKSRAAKHAAAVAAAAPPPDAPGRRRRQVPSAGVGPAPAREPRAAARAQRDMMAANLSHIRGRGMEEEDDSDEEEVYTGGVMSSKRGRSEFEFEDSDYDVFGDELHGGSQASNFMAAAMASAKKRHELPEGFDPHRVRNPSKDMQSHMQDWAYWDEVYRSEGRPKIFRDPAYEVSAPYRRPYRPKPAKPKPAAAAAPRDSGEADFSRYEVRQDGDFLLPAGAKRTQALAALGLPADATAKEVQSAYRRAMLRLHPDKTGGVRTPAFEAVTSAKIALIGGGLEGAGLDDTEDTLRGGLLPRTALTDSDFVEDMPQDNVFKQRYPGLSDFGNRRFAAGPWGYTPSSRKQWVNISGTPNRYDGSSNRGLAAEGGDGKRVHSPFGDVRSFDRAAQFAYQGAGFDG